MGRKYEKFSWTGDCTKDGIEEALTKIFCGIEEISQSNKSIANVTQKHHGKRFMSATFSTII